ncbi:hypothetical protein OAT96_00130 [Chitinophagales bacterium]|nr:hypothetical protein [Chitinophagales bacterium]
MQINLSSLFSLLFLLFFTTSMRAQTFSPQSQFGLGGLHSPLFSANKAMGGISAGFRGTRDINSLNPASYSAISFTTFDIGLQLYGNIISDTARLTDAANGGVNHIALAFPIMQNKWSMAFGLLPYSFKNYTYNNSVLEDGISYNFQSKGTGSTYKLFWGNGLQVKDFSFGFNTNFLFGELDETENILFTDSLGNINTSKHSTMSIKDVSFDFGIQYRVKINKLENENKDRDNIYMTIGAYGAPSFNIKSLSSKYTNSSLTSLLTGEEIPIDSASGGVYGLKEQTRLPAYFGAGLTFGNNTKWTAGIDFHYENWENFSSPLNDLALSNEWRVKVGGEIMPNYKSKKYGSNVSYRLGANFGQSRVSSNNSGVPEFGTTFGFGLPFGKTTGNYRSYSRLNLTVEIGRRGIVSDTAIKENYYKLTLAYSLSDRWFIKRKFD